MNKTGNILLDILQILNITNKETQVIVELFDESSSERISRILEDHASEEIKKDIANIKDQKEVLKKLDPLMQDPKVKEAIREDSLTYMHEFLDEVVNEANDKQKAEIVAYLEEVEKME